MFSLRYKICSMNFLSCSHGQNAMSYGLMRAYWLSDQLFLLRINALETSSQLLSITVWNSFLSNAPWLLESLKKFFLKRRHKQFVFPLIAAEPLFKNLAHRPTMRWSRAASFFKVVNSPPQFRNSLEILYGAFFHLMKCKNWAFWSQGSRK